MVNFAKTAKACWETQNQPQEHVKQTNDYMSDLDGNNKRQRDQDVEHQTSEDSETTNNNNINDKNRKRKKKNAVIWPIIQMIDRT